MLAQYLISGLRPNTSLLVPSVHCRMSIYSCLLPKIASLSGPNRVTSSSLQRGTSLQRCTRAGLSGGNISAERSTIQLHKNMIPKYMDEHEPNAQISGSVLKSE